jgi:hypothetical protein
MHSLTLTPKRKQKEWTLIQLIARNNNFSQNLPQKLNLQIQHKKKPTRNKPMNETKTKHGQPSYTTAQK